MPRGHHLPLALPWILALAVAASGCKQENGDAPQPDPATTSTPGSGAPAAQGGPLLGPRVDALPSEDWNASQIEWMSFEAGLAKAKEQKKPICLVFWAVWCGHCKNYSHVFEDPRVVEKARRFVMVRANVDEEESLSQRYMPDGGYVPRTLFLSPDGAMMRDVHAPRPQYVHFYDERNPSSLLGGMDAALAKAAP